MSYGGCNLGMALFSLACLASTLPGCGPGPGAAVSGQYAVVYDGQTCLGGGEIASVTTLA